MSQKTVLLIDDSRTVRNIMALLLHRHGYRLTAVSSGMEALSILSRFVPDLIFLDMTLPGIDGLDICKIIKENRATRDIPIIILSGNDEVFDKVMGRLAGASDYITKPFDPDEILKCLEMYLKAS